MLKQDITLTVEAPGVFGNGSSNQNVTLTAVKISEPLHGTLDFNNDGSLIYTPESGYSGTDSFEYKLNNGTVYSENATVT